MKTSLPVVRPRSPRSDPDGSDQVQSLIIPTKLVPVADSYEKKEQLWFTTSQIPTDLSIQVQDVTFNVHKYPLISKCGYIGRLELQPSISNFGYELKLEDFPGGSETFEIILKFCYGLPVDLNPENIACLRCASEFLEMTEDLEDGNLISKTEAFLTFVVLSSWRDTIIVLKSCETLSPWAENLQIVRRCCDSIAYKATRDILTTGNIGEGWWSNDLATIRIDYFVRIITAISAKGAKPEILGRCIRHYAERWLPDMDLELEGLRGHGYGRDVLQFCILNGRKEEGSIGHKEQRMIIESLVSILPPQKEAVPCKFLLQLLKMAMVYSATPALISELEKRVGMTLEEATVNDLLIPTYKNGDQGKHANSVGQPSMHNIDVVQRIVEYFLMHEQQQQLTKSNKVTVSKLLDNYLAEIARDPSLSITKFQVLAESLPEDARTCDDGLYRAIDTYLKAHPSLSEHDRKRLCKIMNCEKLSLDACLHAAQNERLPLRTVVQINLQVLFSEQIKMRTAVQLKDPTARAHILEQETSQNSAEIEIKNLRAELETVKSNFAELQREYYELQREYEKLLNKQKHASSWSFGWKKFANYAFFHGKIDGDEPVDAPRRSTTVKCGVLLRRRLSLS